MEFHANNRLSIATAATLEDWYQRQSHIEVAEATQSKRINNRLTLV